jgi:hypothetical protein
MMLKRSYGEEKRNDGPLKGDWSIHRNLDWNRPMGQILTDGDELLQDF